jgi:hypothetical protein
VDFFTVFFILLLYNQQDDGDDLQICGFSYIFFIKIDVFNIFLNGGNGMA